MGARFLYLALPNSAAAAAAAAKSLQSCLTPCDPIDSSPPGSALPGILQARTLKWVAISFSNACMHAKLLQSCPTPYSLWDCKESDVTEHTHTNASAFEFPIVPLLPFQAITGQLVQQHSLICCQVVWLISKYWSYKLVV